MFMDGRADALRMLLPIAQAVNEPENNNKDRDNPCESALPLKNFISDLLNLQLLRKVLDVLTLFQAQKLFVFDFLLDLVFNLANCAFC